MSTLLHSTPVSQQAEIINPDSDRRFARPAAWRKAKEAFGSQLGIRSLMSMIEREEYFRYPEDSVGHAI